MPTAKDLHSQLARGIEAHTYRYYVLDDPVVTDREFDVLMQNLRALELQGPLLGKSPCVTGVLTRKREDVHALLRAAGATIHDSVKKDTSYLVAGEKTGKTKLDQATKYGAKVITEEEMDRLLAVETPPEQTA